MDKLYADARYDGSRFYVPSFQAAGALWLNLIVTKEREFIQEIARVLKTLDATLQKKDAAAIKRMIEEVFAEARYLERMRIFSEGVARKARSYGLVFDAQAHGVNIAESAYRAGAMNALRRARSNVLAEFKLHGQPRPPEFVRSLSRGWHYFRLHPWKFLVAAVLMVLIPWLFAKISFGDMLQ